MSAPLWNGNDGGSALLVDALDKLHPGIDRLPKDVLSQTVRLNTAAADENMPVAIFEAQDLGNEPDSVCHVRGLQTLAEQRPTEKANIADLNGKLRTCTDGSMIPLSAVPLFGVGPLEAERDHPATTSGGAFAPCHDCEDTLWCSAFSCWVKDAHGLGHKVRDL